MTSQYAASGVNIDAGNRAVELMRDAVQSTHGPEVLASLGAFGGLFDATGLMQLSDPVLVASTDGVGTKMKLAAQAGRYESLGHDIVNHCINDILVQGARPLFFLDYFAGARLVPEMAAAVVHGIAAACREVGCALLGGETAEMPGVYRSNEFDLVGTVIGVVERDQILPRSDVEPGDLLLGLSASGAHTNGFSLIRRVFDGIPLDKVFPELGQPLADVLLAPHRCYLSTLQARDSTQPKASIKALAHITGGGFVENIPRVLPENLGAALHRDTWPVPPLFQLIQQRTGMTSKEMFRVFNMGIGMIAIVSPEVAPTLQETIDEETWIIGEVTPGKRGVELL